MAGLKKNEGKMGGSRRWQFN